MTERFHHLSFVVPAESWLSVRMSVLALILAGCLGGQPVVAPSTEPVGAARGEDIAGYNVVQSFETGYRFRQVGGNEGKYRSDVNFGNGLRLLGSNLSVHSREGQGKYFDELLLNTQGLGNDPYQSSPLRVRKNKLYSYDLLWRLNDYYNPALAVSAGLHFQNTTRTMQDHNLVLLPQSPIRFFAGFSRVSQSGDGLSTANLLGIAGSDEFTPFATFRRLQNEFRLGFELNAFGTKLSVLRGWEGFRDDTRRDSGPSAGQSLDDTSSISLLRRDEPYHGSTRNWRVNLLHDRSKWFSANGRFTYAGTRRNFLFDELAIGTSRFGSSFNRQILVAGEGRRPVITGALTMNFFPSDAVTVTSHTAFHHTRMDGDGAYRELDNATLSFVTQEFGFLGIRTITNSTDVNVRLHKAAGVFGGYQFSTRRTRSIEQSFEEVALRTEAEQENQLHVGRAGFRLQPVKPLSIVVDGEIGRADRPVFPTSERNYHVLGGRIQYRTRSVVLAAYTRANYNFNSASLFSYSSRSRQYAADASWTARPWLSFDANYSKLHLNTVGGIAYFFDRQLIADQSVYISNIHSGTAGVRLGIRSRADLFVGYSRIQDTGDGRPAIYAAPWVPGVTPTVIGPGTLGYQTYPVTFESPFARLSLRLHPKLRWNAGYQHYRYGEELLPLQNYRAHTGFTSLSWSF